MQTRERKLPVGYRLFIVQFAPDDLRYQPRPAGQYAFVLSSLVEFHRYLPFRREYEAICSEGRLREHLLDSVRVKRNVHGCGFYGVWKPKFLCDQFHEYIACARGKPSAMKVPWLVLAGVSPAGVVAAGPEGFRASQMVLEWFYRMPVVGGPMVEVHVGKLRLANLDQYRSLSQNTSLLNRIGNMFVEQEYGVGDIEVLLILEGIKNYSLRKLGESIFHWSTVRPEDIEEGVKHKIALGNNMFLVVKEDALDMTFHFCLYTTYDTVLDILSYNYSTPVLAKPETWG